MCVLLIGMHEGVKNSLSVRGKYLMTKHNVTLSFTIYESHYILERLELGAVRLLLFIMFLLTNNHVYNTTKDYGHYNGLEQCSSVIA